MTFHKKLIWTSTGWNLQDNWQTQSYAWARWRFYSTYSFRKLKPAAPKRTRVRTPQRCSSLSGPQVLSCEKWGGRRGRQTLRKPSFSCPRETFLRGSQPNLQQLLLSTPLPAFFQLALVARFSEATTAAARDEAEQAGLSGQLHAFCSPFLQLHWGRFGAHQHNPRVRVRSAWRSSEHNKGCPKSLLL